MLSHDTLMPKQMDCICGDGRFAVENLVNRLNVGGALCKQKHTRSYRAPAVLTDTVGEKPECSVGVEGGAELGCWFHFPVAYTWSWLC